MGRGNNNHRRALEKIANHPEKFDLPALSDGVIRVSIEENLYHGGRLIAQTDIILETNHGEVYIVEFKGYIKQNGSRHNGNGETNGYLLDRARRQLEQAKWWYGNTKPNIPPNKIHTRLISGDDERYKDLLRGLGLES